MLFSRRGAIGAAAAALLGGAGYWWYTREPSDVDVFNETNGDLRGDIECNKQIHSGSEFGELVRRNPAMIDHYVHLHRDIFRRLVEQHRLRPDSVYLLEGCTRSVQQRLLANQEFLAITDHIRDEVQRNPAEAIRGLKGILPRVPPAAMSQYLKHFEAAALFMAETRNTNPRIFGTEPDGYVMLVDFVSQEFHALAELQQRGELTDEVLNAAAHRMNAKKNEEMPLRHRYIRDTLRTELRDGQKAHVVLGAAHFRSGAHLTTPDDPLEDYLQELPNRRVRVVDSGRLSPLIRSMPQIRMVHTFTRDTLRTMLKQTGKM